MEKLKAINVSNKLTEENTHCGPDPEHTKNNRYYVMLCIFANPHVSYPCKIVILYHITHVNFS